mmetsp:Transcript_13990/g.21643  ORF Transcript_13990/g.21643 Transcript_13990/m.21643 type:complete len:140 (+) Transcript_13990:167-586(+)|eukprot:CAMPEP_0201727298 /NCGR_PEP_ID=MMETSP0593-20130828/11824_1 /ASSEMBLY_ACC=CAM_ASM_000672 /TAXON_ID=267983 /ORGANISM="Skeletonema japonicum, Strain CCMP2506" /LENGTH=139 /DNA_ID=CAMNT_0048219035 /DNA_START=13 /DNA_END=432 /DNA_ORIENTATION=+
MALGLFSSNPNSGDPYAPPSPNDDDNSILSHYRPLIQQFSLSSLLGYCSAVSAKRIGKTLAFIGGLAFVSLQALVHKGFISVDWKKIEESVKDAVDTDDDGEFTEKDVQRYLERVKIFLMENIPDASGFGVGFMLGLKS